MGLREAKRLRTEQAIVAAAWELFESAGYDATTVEAIAERADVSKSSFFRYFDTKASVVFAHARMDFAELRGCILDRPTSEPLFTALREGFLDFCPYLEAHLGVICVRYDLVRKNPELIPFRYVRQAQWEAEIHSALVQRNDGGLPAAVCVLLAGIGRTILVKGVDEWEQKSWRGSAEPMLRALFAEVVAAVEGAT